MKKIAMFLLITRGIWGEVFVEPEYTKIGGTFSVSGSGFLAGEDVLVEGCNISKKLTASPEGRFRCEFEVSVIPGGEYVITATSASRVETGRIWIVPVVKLTPNSGSFGDEIEVSGYGYGLGERIQIGMGRQHVLAEAYTSTDTGTFKAKFIVSDHPKGENHLFAIGHSTYLLAEEAFIVKPKVLLEPSSGCVESGISLSGKGFTPQEEVKIDFGTIETLSTCVADRDGCFQLYFNCPRLSGGDQRILASSKDFTESLTFSIKPRLILCEPKRGYVGTPINIALDGLIPNEVLTIGFDNKEEYATYTINEDGIFNEGLIVDTRPGGLKTITIKTHSGIFNTQTFEIRPSIAFITPSEPNPGQRIIFEGVGFNAFEKIRVDFGRREAILWTESNENGTFTGEYIIQDEPGSYRLSAIGYQTSRAAVASINVVPKEEKKE